MAVELNLRLHASTPSNHLWLLTFLLSVPPQFLYQAPPGAQQLTLPDFKNVPHVGHATVLAIVEVIVGVPTDVGIGVRAISSRSGIVTYWRVASVEAAVHAVCAIDPDEPGNINSLLAIEWTQAAPQSF